MSKILEGGFKVANLLSEANIVTNKNLIPKDKPEDWDKPSGLRIGTTKITRLGMKEEQMEFLANVLKNPEKGEKTKSKILELRRTFNKTHYCFEE